MGVGRRGGEWCFSIMGALCAPLARSNLMLQCNREACILSRKRQSPWRTTNDDQKLEEVVD